MIRHRPAAGGRSDHWSIGLLSLLFAVLVGICGAILSLLLRWPSLGEASPFIKAAAQAHVPVLVFYAAVPASLCGLAVALLPTQIGADRTAFPVLDRVALGLSISALVALVAGSLETGFLGIAVSATMLASAVVITSANLIATVLIERTIAYSALPSFAWTTLVAAAFALCAAPIILATYTFSLWHGVLPDASLAEMICPALCVVLLVMLGLVNDIICGVPQSGGPSTRVLIGLLGGEMLAVFMAWGFCLENRIVFAPAIGTMQGCFLVLSMPFEVVWALMLVRAPGNLLSRRLPTLFAVGFALMLAVGLLAGLFGLASHEATSLAVVFGLLAGFFRLTSQRVRGPFAMWSAQVQFWLLLGGSVSLLLPVPAPLKVLGAAMSSLSVGLFVAYLIALLLRPRSIGRKADNLMAARPVLPHEGHRS